MNFRFFFRLLKTSASEWLADNAMRLSAALAYYAIFSLAPLLLVIIAIAGLVFGEESARQQISQSVQQLAGEQAGKAIEGLARNPEHRESSILATIIGLVVLLFGASGVFGELKNALNQVWGVVVKPGQSIFRFIVDRLLSFGMVLGIGFLLLVSLVLSALLAALGTYLKGLLNWPPALMYALNLLISLVVIAVLFAMLFKFLPNVKVRWHDVWIGAVGTSVLFALGQFLIGLYLGKSTVASTYGAAGSIIIILLWIYYSGCILLFGAEFTKVYARERGAGISPSEEAMPIAEARKENEKEGS